MPLRFVHPFIGAPLLVVDEVRDHASAHASEVLACAAQIAGPYATATDLGRALAVVAGSFVRAMALSRLVPELEETASIELAPVTERDWLPRWLAHAFALDLPTDAIATAFRAAPDAIRVQCDVDHIRVHLTGTVATEWRTDQDFLDRFVGDPADLQAIVDLATALDV